VSGPRNWAIIWAIIALFTATIVWAYFGHLDIVAVAQGKVIPKGRSKVIQPFETSIVRAIHVEDGQSVTRGDVLVELDATDVEASLEQVRDELRATKNEVQRSKALIQALATRRLVSTEFETLFSADDWPLQEQLLIASYEEIDASVDEIRHAIERAESARTSSEEQVLKLESVLPIITERTDALEGLSERNLVSRSQYLELKQQRIEAEQDLKSERASRQSADAQVNELTNRLAATIARERSAILIGQDELERRVDSLEQELAKASQATAHRKLVAPVDGVVQQLSVYTLGGVVTPAEQLMVIVPDDQQLEVEVLVLNRDIGFVREEQEAVVKLDAFPYTRYGYIDAVVENISDDAVPYEDLGLAYPAKIKLDRITLMVEGREVSLSPGMSVTVEIKTGKRRVIEFLMSPLLRYKSESARER
jgi:hemolysin D